MQGLQGVVKPQLMTNLENVDRKDIMFRIWKGKWWWRSPLGRCGKGLANDQPAEPGQQRKRI